MTAKGKFLGLGLTLFFGACNGLAFDARQLPNRHGGRVQVLGHAGSGFTSPMLPFNPLPSNSWAGIRQALDRGADGIEVDVQLSADSLPVLYHDRQLGSLTTRPGCVGDWPADSLARTPYRMGWFYDLFQHERVLRLDTLLVRLGRRPTFPLLHLDLHEEDECHPNHDPVRSAALLRALGRALHAHPAAAPQLLLTSMTPATLATARQLLPAVPRALEVTAESTLAAGLAAPNRADFQTLVLSRELGTPANVRRAHAAGFDVALFGGRSAGSIRRELEAAPDAIETDNVPVLQQLLGQE